MPIKTCNDCGKQVCDDKPSGKYWCVNCKEVKEEYEMKYKIALLGKNTGKPTGYNNYIKCLGRALEKLGHYIIEINFDDVVSEIVQWDLEMCIKRKRKINLKPIEYYESPDFIIVEQMYYRFDRSEVNCPVIYLHREYTHFPDIEHPDILLGMYPERINFFEYYHPYAYHNIPYVDNLFIAVDPENIQESEEGRIFQKIYHLTWAAPPINFANANGIAARMVIEDQVAFVAECKRLGYVSQLAGGKQKKYFELLSMCEATLIDPGYINYIGRRLFEAMASKTLCIVRLAHTKQRDFFKEIGLSEDMCFFVYDPYDLKDILDNWDEEENAKKIDLAYKWTMKNHTYDNRAKRLLEIYEEYKNGKRQRPYFMGYANRFETEIGHAGEIVVEKI